MKNKYEKYDYCWDESSLTATGIEQAEALAPTIEAWLKKYWTEETFPEEMALVARETVRVVAVKLDLYRKFQSRRFKKRK